MTTYNRWKILHISSGAIFEANSLSKNKDQFGLELSVALDFAIAPVKNSKDITKIHKTAIKQLRELNLKYNYHDETAEIPNWWVHDFVTFILQHCFSKDLTPEDTFSIPWTDICRSDFEIL